MIGEQFEEIMTSDIRHRGLNFHAEPLANMQMLSCHRPGHLSLQLSGEDIARMGLPRWNHLGAIRPKSTPNEQFRRMACVSADIGARLTGSLAITGCSCFPHQERKEPHRAFWDPKVDDRMLSKAVFGCLLASHRAGNMRCARLRGFLSGFFPIPFYRVQLPLPARP